MEVVDGALEEALHLGGVQVDGDYVLDASDPQ